MPKKPLDPNLILEAEPAPPAEPSTWDAIGGWPGAAAAGVRGVLGSVGVGGPTGAISGGGSEALAQLIEYLGGVGPDLTIPERLGRVGVEAGVGYIPFGQVAKKGQLLRNLIRGGTLSGAGEAARESELLGGEGINPASVGLAAGLGGGATAGVQGLSDLLLGGVKTAPRAAADVVETTAHPGGRQGFGKDQAPVRQPRAQTPTRAPAAQPPTARPRVSSEVPYRVGEVPETPALTPEQINASFAPRSAGDDLAAALGVPTKAPGEVPGFDPDAFDAAMGPSTRGVAYPLGVDDRLGPSASFQRNAATAERTQLQEGTEQARALDRQVKTQGEAERAAAIQAEREAAGLQPQTSYTETVAGTTPQGTKASKTTRFAEPQADDNLASMLGVEPSAVGKQGGPRSFIPAEQVSSPVPTEATDDFGQMILNQGQPFKSRVDASGAGYRGAKAAGDVPKDVLGKVHGRALQREGQEAGLPPRGPVPEGAPQPSTPTAPEVGPEWVQEQLGVVDRLKRFMSEQGGGGFGGESGLVHPEIATSLASGALGGLLGAATDPFGNPIASGLTGAVAGGLLPHAPAIARQGGEALGELYEKGRESLGENLSDFGETALQAVEKIPNYQRFNLLSSGPGLVSNAFLGPWGGAATGALERGLAGDARGWDALSEVANPVKFARNMWGNRGEALDLLKKGELGRDEAINPGVGEDLVDTALAGPGWAMTAGDVTARRGLQGAGFLEDEARRMTHTAEPKTGFGRTLAHFGAGGDNTLMDRLLKVGTSLMAPFRRTPANIMESGFERLPGVGAALQFAGGNTNARELAAQQALSAGYTGAGYLAGSEIEDPWWSRETRRALSNVAGQYSMPASLGFAAGRAQNEALPAQRPGTAVREMFPLPATENLTQLGSMMFGDNPDAKPPRGMVPAAWRELPAEIRQGLGDSTDWDNTETETIPNLPRFRNR